MNKIKSKSYWQPKYMRIWNMSFFLTELIKHLDINSLFNLHQVNKNIRRYILKHSIKLKIYIDDVLHFYKEYDYRVGSKMICYGKYRFLFNFHLIGKKDICLCSFIINFIDLVNMDTIEFSDIESCITLLNGLNTKCKESYHAECVYKLYNICHFKEYPKLDELYYRYKADIEHYIRRLDY